MNQLQLYRLWLGTEDYGTAVEQPARRWLEVALRRNPDARIEPVAPDAPEFLNPPASDCCQAPLRLAGDPRSSHRYECSECGKACGVEPPEDAPGPDHTEPQDETQEFCDSHSYECAGSAALRALLVTEAVEAAEEPEQQQHDDE